MKLEYWENEGQTKRLENLAVSKFFKISNDEIVGNDIINYCLDSNLKFLSPYDRIKAALKAIDRCGENIDYYIEDFENFREIVFHYYG